MVPNSAPLPVLDDATLANLDEEWTCMGQGPTQPLDAVELDPELLAQAEYLVTEGARLATGCPTALYLFIRRAIWMALIDS